jgi:hypothetical protein
MGGNLWQNPEPNGVLSAPGLAINLKEVVKKSSPGKC